MKNILDTFCIISFFIGVFLVAGAIGADDVAVMTHQAHSIDFVSILVGFCGCVPLVLFYGAEYGE